jgi:hypothetical protein
LADALGEDRHEDDVHARVLPTEALEVVAEHRVRLRRLERLDGRRAIVLLRHEGQLPERGPPPTHGERCGVAERRGDPHREAPAGDQMEGVRRVAAMEDDLATGERPPSRDREHGADGVLRHLGEERPLHGLCRELDTTTVAHTNDSAQTGS